MKPVFILFIVFFGCLSFLVFSCAAKSQNHNEGCLQQISTFYDANGNISFAPKQSIWSKNSSAIQEITVIYFNTDTNKKRTASYSVDFYRYTDVIKGIYLDYRTFADTAKPFAQGILPDSVMDNGWSYYSDKALQIQGEPKSLTDTVFDGIAYRRIRFSFARQDSTKAFQVGYLRCDLPFSIFSLEHTYSRKHKCIMTKIANFKVGEPNPYANMEVQFKSDQLTNEQRKVFAAWEKNASLINSTLYHK